MYNPYLSPHRDIAPPRRNPPPPKRNAAAPKREAQASQKEQPPKKGVSELLKVLKLEDLDTGDVLLLLILLFLFLDDREDNLEVLITLGLMLVL